MFGDSTALTLAIGLSEHQSHYDITEYDQGILGCGVAEGAEFQLKGVDAPMATKCTAILQRPVAADLEVPGSHQAPQRRHDPGRSLGGREPHIRREVDQHREPRLRRLRQAPARHGRAHRRFRRSQGRPPHCPLLRQRRTAGRASRGPRTHRSDWRSTTTSSERSPPRYLARRSSTSTPWPARTATTRSTSTASRSESPMAFTSPSAAGTSSPQGSGPPWPGWDAKRWPSWHSTNRARGTSSGPSRTPRGR